jgi:hypothetical protein
MRTPRETVRRMAARKAASGRKYGVAAALHPVLADDAGDVGYYRALDAGHHVEPARAAAGRLQPPVGDAGAADERNPAVDHEQLAVGAVVQAAQAVPREVLIRLHPGARRAQRLPDPPERAEAADRVHDEGHADAGARPLGERFDEPIADCTLLEDVALHVDGFAGAADRVQHGRIERLAVGQDVDLVAVLQVRLAGRLQDVDEVIAARVDVRFDVIGNVRREERRHDQPRDERPADVRQPEHGTSSATGKCSKSAAAAIDGPSAVTSGRIVAPVKT